MNLLTVFGSVMGGIMKAIPDADKRMEFAFKTQEMMNQFMVHMLQTKTYPWIDGVVKLAYASEHILKGLLRPVGALLMFAYGVYAQTNNIALDELTQSLLFGAPIAWGVSRHAEKKRKPLETEFNQFE